MAAPHRAAADSQRSVVSSARAMVTRRDSAGEGSPEKARVEIAPRRMRHRGRTWGIGGDTSMLKVYFQLELSPDRFGNAGTVRGLFGITRTVLISRRARSH